MAGRGAPTFQKRQKEQLRKEKREAKLARRHQKKHDENVQSPESVQPEDRSEFESDSPQTSNFDNEH
jgi:hypothetical protein